MEKRLQEMLDHYEISKTLNQYCRGCDRCDETLMSSVYLEDSWDDHGALQAPGPEFSKIMIQNVKATTESLSHLLGQSLIDVKGDEAGAETYFIAASRSFDGDGVELCNQLGGRYIDKLLRDGEGRWRIQHRTVVRDWSISIPAHEYDWTKASKLREGARSSVDPSFAVLGFSGAR